MRSILVTVEHGGNEVPAEFAELFRGFETLIESHRGWDPGALDLGRDLARRLDAHLIASRTTRLLVDLNRSPRNRTVFSEVTRGLPRAVRHDLIERYHLPHHQAVGEYVEKAVGSGAGVLHLGVHSFTPVLNGRHRTADLGVLYDPRRGGERALGARMKPVLERLLPGWPVRRNYPYRGGADGLSTILRRRFDEADYLGIELEVNQARRGGDGRFPGEVAAGVAEAVRLSM